MSFWRRASSRPTGDRPAGAPAGRGANDPLELWFALAKIDWSCLVLVPAFPEIAADEIAKSLADAGQHLNDHRVSAVTVKILGPDSVRALATLAGNFSDRRENPRLRAANSFDLRRLAPHDCAAEPPAAGPVEPEVLGPDEAPDIEPLVAEPAGTSLPSGQLIISIPSVISQPLGIAVARAADGVLLVVEVGRTPLADLSRTVEAIGREHILGTCLISRSRPAPGRRW